MNAIVIGNKIADGRKSKRLSQAEFAQELNISHQAVSKWERGDSLPDVLMLGKIADVIGVDLNYFSSESLGIANGKDTKAENNKETEKKNAQRGKKMGNANWKDADFSGLSDLNKKMSSSNVERCKFVGADMRGLIFRANNMNKNDFTNAQMGECRFSMSNVEDNNFTDADLNGTEISGSNFDKNDFTRANFTNAIIKGSQFDENNLAGAVFCGTQFSKNQIKKLVFSGAMTDCSFVYNVYKKVEFKGVIFKNVFIKGRIKGATFVDCKADKLTIAFLKASGADVTSIMVID